MTVLVLGATGLLGTEVMKVLKARGIPALGAARSGTDIAVDITRPMDLFRHLIGTGADAVINCAANVNLADCEDSPELAYRINGAPAGVLSAWSKQTGGYVIQVSTDNYFAGEPRIKNDEEAQVTLLNAYAASKFAGESMTVKAENSLVVRTNICGASKGFGKWVMDSLLARAPISAFDDYFTSTMHVRDCAEALADFLDQKRTGLVNLASSDVSSKSEFIRAVADALNISHKTISERSAKGMTPERALSCGLDVRKAEDWLGRPLPGLKETVRTLVSEDPRCATITNYKLATAS